LSYYLNRPATTQGKVHDREADLQADEDFISILKKIKQNKEQEDGGDSDKAFFYPKITTDQQLMK
jgi:hypothetical protein